MAYRTSREHFEELAGKAMDALPEEFTALFTNITVIVEDYPAEEESRQVNATKKNLLGLFSGVPYQYKGGFFEIPYPMPDKITLFQKNIENICSTEKELIEEIRKTLIHEVGHYFGLSEKDLRKYE